jgi:hypothetical protein
VEACGKKKKAQSRIKLEAISFAIFCCDDGVGCMKQQPNCCALCLHFERNMASLFVVVYSRVVSKQGGVIRTSCYIALGVEIQNTVIKHKTSYETRRYRGSQASIALPCLQAPDSVSLSPHISFRCNKKSLHR